MNGNDLIYDEMNVLLQKENMRFLEQIHVLVTALETIKKEVDDDGMGGWLTDTVNDALNEYRNL